MDTVILTFSRPETTSAVTRGAARLFVGLGYAPLLEVGLPNGRRADIMALGPRGQIVNRRSSLTPNRRAILTPLTRVFAVARRRSAEPLAERSAEPPGAPEAGADQERFLSR